MKYLTNILLILFSFISLISFSQKKALKGYRIEGEYIVFTFDKRDYTKATNERTNKKLDFNDFDIENVVVSGNFNFWSRDSWKMQKIDNNLYELRKKITDFNDDFNWEFKLLATIKILDK